MSGKPVEGDGKNASTTVDTYGDHAALHHEHFALEHSETFQTTYDQAAEGKLFHEGQMVIMPAPTRDPKDPMNLSLQRKILGVFCMAFFGALAASAEIILGAVLPIFVLQYRNVPYSFLFPDSFHLPEGTNGLRTLEAFGIGTSIPSVFDIYLLAALPLLMIGVSNLFFVPFAIAIGRRPVILASACIAIAGACWAGASKSLGSHQGARCIQAIGAGTVESLIPFIIQDMVPIHRRNTWISAAFAAQGVIIIAVGFSAPYIIIAKGWPWVYYITAIAAAVFLIGIFAFLPETRWNRTRSEMTRMQDGVPRDDAHIQYAPRTLKGDIALIKGTMEWRKGFKALVDTLRTFFLPQVFFITMLNAAMISSTFAASYTAAPVLLTVPYSWPFRHLGFALTAVLVASVIVAFVTGGLADALANTLARTRGVRSAENQLINLILPTSLGAIGSILFGLCGSHMVAYPWPVFLMSIGFLAFGFLGTSSIGTVYVLECYPHLAGPALVSIASFRFIIAFLLTFYTVDWIIDLGYLKAFSIYTALIAAFMIFIPVVYCFGPSWRRRWPATR